MDGEEASGAFVIGTAGHVDHGKSALVKALTGTDPDRLPEEKLRGMTIDLGFAFMRRPDGSPISIVDVPGHERFIANMVAGAAGVDMVLLVVAADEGVMPQTLEHVQILHLLGAHRYLVALTKKDLVDSELLALVESEIRDLLAGFGSQPEGVFAVSALTGDGLAELREALQNSTPASLPDAGLTLPRLPVDRVLAIKGFGTVVTGTSTGGELTEGQLVEVSPSAGEVRIRTMQIHGRRVGKASAGARLALNLVGRRVHEITRGDVVGLPGLNPAVKRVDALVTILPDAPSLTADTEVTIHAGAAVSTGRVVGLSSPDTDRAERSWAQLRLNCPMVLWRGQRFIMRRLSPRLTIGGGVVAGIAAPRHVRRRDPGGLAQLLSSDPMQVIEAVLGERSLGVGDLARMTNFSEPAVERFVLQLQTDGRVVRCGDVSLSAARFYRSCGELSSRVEQYHTQYPERVGMPREELRRSLRLSGSVFQRVADALVARGMISLASSEAGGGDALIALKSYVAARSSADEEHFDNREKFLAALDVAGNTPPLIGDLMSRHSIDGETLRGLRERGRVVKISEDIYMGASAFREVVACVADLIRSDGKVTVAQVRDRLGTTRKYVVPILELLDGQGVTRRRGDWRIAGPRFPAADTEAADPSDRVSTA